LSIERIRIFIVRGNIYLRSGHWTQKGFTSCWVLLSLLGFLSSVLDSIANAEADLCYALITRSDTLQYKVFLCKKMFFLVPVINP
jgi:hypothetical protein